MTSTNVVTWPAPSHEIPSPDFTLSVNGKHIFVYQARVRAEILEQKGLWSHKPDPKGEKASFAIFDITGPVTVTVTPSRRFTAAEVLPRRSGVKAQVAGGTVSFTIEKPRHLTLLLDGTHEAPLHLFISEPEKNVPSPDDPDVVYFGPGVHEITTLEVKSNQTIYLAGGAVVKAVLDPADKGVFNEKWNIFFYNGVAIPVQKVKNVRICGRGILDGSAMPHPGHNLVLISESENIELEGITLRDSPNWNVCISKSGKVRAKNVRIISGRLNSDGINSVNSNHVLVEDCFIRNHDDSIAAKTTQPELPCESITARNCTVWNDWGFALGATYETRAPIRYVRFIDCSILFSRHWCTGIRVSDSATVSDISFTGLEVADLFAGKLLGGSHGTLTQEPKLIFLSIVKDVWGTDPEAGHINNIEFSGITVCGSKMPESEFVGFDTAHQIENIRIKSVKLEGHEPVRDAAALNLKCNEFVKNVRIEE